MTAKPAPLPVQHARASRSVSGSSSWPMSFAALSRKPGRHHAAWACACPAPARRLAAAGRDSRGSARLSTCRPLGAGGSVGDEENEGTPHSGRSLPQRPGVAMARRAAEDGLRVPRTGGPAAPQVLILKADGIIGTHSRLVHPPKVPSPAPTDPRHRTYPAPTATLAPSRPSIPPCAQTVAH